MNNDIYQIDFTEIFPTALQHDPKMIALAKSLTAELLTVSGHMEDVLIYYRIDQLPEELVDILAYDMHVDWYSYEDPLAVKRQTLKDSVKVHKHLGTKYAVETAIQAFFPGGTVQEWFDYEGQPHHFRISATLSRNVIQVKEIERLFRLICHVKRLSSWLDEIIFTIALPAATLRVGGKAGVQTQIGVPQEPDRYDFRGALHVGGALGAEASVGAPAEPDRYDFQTTLHAGGALSGQAALPVPEDPAQPAAATILRTGGVCTIISNLPPTRGD